MVRKMNDFKKNSVILLRIVSKTIKKYPDKSVFFQGIVSYKNSIYQIDLPLNL